MDGIKKSQICRMVGISAETLRYYVNEGIIHPRQDPGNYYFYYSKEDAIRLLQIRMMRGYGTPVRVISQKISAIKDGRSFDAFLDGLEADLLQQKREIEERLRILRFWRGELGADTPPVYLYHDEAPEYAAFYRKTEESVAKVQKMQQYMPKAYVTLQLSADRPSYDVGLTVSGSLIDQQTREDFAKDFLVLSEDRILMDLHYDDISQISFSDFAPVFDYAARHNFQVTSNVFCILYRIFTDHGRVGCDLTGGVTVDVQ